MGQLSKDEANQITIEFLKKLKNSEKVEVMFTEMKDNCWVVSGTTPIELGESQWPERFTVTVDSKGKVKSSNFRLL
jgi:hypothetical protein